MRVKIGQIDSVNPHLVSVGDYAVLGAHSALLTDCPIKGAQPVSVGAYSYIAYGALILPDVSVGECCVIGGCRRDPFSARCNCRCRYSGARLAEIDAL